METFSALLAICEGNSPVTGGFISQRLETRSLDAFFDLRLNKRLSKQSTRRRFETPSRSSWRQCNGIGHSIKKQDDLNGITGIQTWDLHVQNTNKSHYIDVIMGAIASQITGVSIAYSTVCSGVEQRNHQNSVPLAVLRWIQQCPVNSPCKGPVTRKMFPFDDVIMNGESVGTG